jgi:hypothetical protein
MPRKATKTAAKPSKAPDQGVDTTQAAQTPQEPPKKKIGRPSKYSPEIAREMCELLSEGIPLREICRKDGFPEWRTVYDWMNRDEDLSAAIARAREVGQDAIAEQIWLDMKQEPERILSEGGGRVDSGYVQWQKAKAEIALKLLAKWNPKRYGDRVQLAGDAENPLKVEADISIFDTVLKGIEQSRRG